MSEIMDTIGPLAKQASTQLAQANTESINIALSKIANALEENQDAILEINATETKAATDKGQTKAIIDRLTLTPERISAIANSVRSIAEQPDPVNKTLASTTRPNGLIIEKRSVPIGVLGIIYEARPNVTVDAAALCLKSHNAVILRGGSECFQTAYKLFEVMRDAIKDSDISIDAVQMIPDTDRAHVGNMLKADQFIDVIIPRGGKGLIARVQKEAQMPVFSHLDGICHTYICADATPQMALDISLNAKMRRTGICGATETILIDANTENELIKNIVGNLKNAGCEIIADNKILSLAPDATPATEDDWKTEYLDAKVSIKTVSSIDDAIMHINKYGSHHTDAIITNDNQKAQKFLNEVDSANVMHNCSTQFADGGEFGMGAEIGIATGKFHARGPVGAEQLTTYKYLVKGNGQTRPS